MKRIDVEHALNAVQVAERTWLEARAEFNTGLTYTMHRLLHEAAHNFMSVEDIAKISGWSLKRVRTTMRSIGLDPRDGVRLLSRKAAEALANNTALMGIEPSEMDLTSPLAYLPMGDKMKRELQAKTVSQVDEIPEVSGNEDLRRLLADLRNEYPRPTLSAEREFVDRYEDVNDILTRIERLVQS